VSAVLLAASSASVVYAGRALRRERQAPLRWTLPAALLLLGGAWLLEGWSHWQAGLRPQDSGYAATVYALIGYQGVLTVVLCFMGGYTLARSLAGRLGPRQRGSFFNTALMWHYIAAQGLIALFIMHGLATQAGG